MRRVLLSAAVLLFAFAAGAGAKQEFPGLNIGSFIGYVDRFDAFEEVTLRPVRLHGWAYDCSTGQTGGTGQLFVDGQQVPVMFGFHLRRPDVQRAHRDACVTTPEAGIYADFYTTPGVHRIDGFVGDGGGTFFFGATIVVH